MFLMQARQIATALDHESNLKIFPVFGDGAVSAPQVMANYTDIGATILPSDIPVYRQSQKLTHVDDLTYVAKLGSLPIFLVARKDIANIAGLSGKRVATGPASSATFATGELVLGANNVSFLRVPLSGPDGLNALASGRADAALVLGKSPALASLPAGQFHILALTTSPQMPSVYQPALLNAEDAPNLMKAGETVETLAPALVIAVPAKVRSQALTAFESELLKYERRAGGANLAAEVPGWFRAAGVADILKQTQVNIQPTGGTP
jgi:ABC-type nitrate/sulfonate/bicarbonate transport system substrate-binding protein